MNFDISRMRRADQIVGGGAIALFIFMFFFKWFGGSVSGALPAGNVGGLSSSSTGWQTFSNSRWIWLITIIVAAGSVLIAVSQSRIEGPLQPGVVVAALGALSALLIFYRIVHHPSASANFGSFHASYGIKIGIWLGLLAALAITYGGYLQMQAEGRPLSGVRKQVGEAFSGITVAGGGGSASGTAGTPVQPTPTPTPPTPTPPTPTPPQPTAPPLSPAPPDPPPGPPSAGGEAAPTPPGL